MPDDSKRGDETVLAGDPDAMGADRGVGEERSLGDRARGLLGKARRRDGDREVPPTETVDDLDAGEGRDPGTVLITGCSSGIGRATALTFLEDDWTVYATSREESDLDDLADVGCETASLDVTDPEQVHAVVERVVEEDGRIDALVNNAGVGLFGPVEEVPTEAFGDQLDVNLLGPHRMLKAVLPHMREQGRGAIVNVSSVAGRVAFPGGGAYCATKFGLEALSDALRAEVEEHGIEVSVVEPGPVDSGFRDRAEEEVERLERTGAYGWFDDAFEDWKLFGGGGPFATSPREVADAVHHAATCPDPEPRYAVGKTSSLAGVGRVVPDRWRDLGFRVVQRVLG